MSTKTLISIAEFDRLEAPEGLRYELDEGELIEMTKARYQPHNRIVRVLDRAVTSYLNANPIGDLLSSDNLFVLGPGIKRAPDLSFMLKARIEQIEADQDIQGAPDLAIEVLSPSDTVSFIRRKIRQYFAAGCRLVWVVYPETREVEVWEAPGISRIILGEKDMLDPPALLPGFSIRVGDIF